ncbi:MAG TPA: hypothetical protein VHL78_13015 [Actinomycetota bacterium]|nr:hypothetical protein [Actinomycetota bacterium]
MSFLAALLALMVLIGGVLTSPVPERPFQLDPGTQAPPITLPFPGDVTFGPDGSDGRFAIIAGLGSGPLAFVGAAEAAGDGPSGRSELADGGRDRGDRTGRDRGRGGRDGDGRGGGRGGSDADRAPARSRGESGGNGGESHKGDGGKGDGGKGGGGKGGGTKGGGSGGGRANVAAGPGGGGGAPKGVGPSQGGGSKGGGSKGGGSNGGGSGKGPGNGKKGKGGGR